MWEVFVVVLQVLAFVAGMLLLYAAAFLYEGEVGAVQNRLEEWWIRMDDVRDHAVSRHTDLLRRGAALHLDPSYRSPEPPARCRASRRSLTAEAAPGFRRAPHRPGRAARPPRNLSDSAAFHPQGAPITRSKRRSAPAFGPIRPQAGSGPRLRSGARPGKLITRLFDWIFLFR